MKPSPCFAWQCGAMRKRITFEATIVPQSSTAKRKAGPSTRLHPALVALVHLLAQQAAAELICISQTDNEADDK